jgi:hypothetical protein
VRIRVSVNEGMTNKYRIIYDLDEVEAFDPGPIFVRIKRREWDYLYVMPGWFFEVFSDEAKT